MSRKRKLPSLAEFKPLEGQLGVRFSFAGTAFLNRYSDLLEPLSLTPPRVLALSFVLSHPGSEQKALARSLSVNEATAMSLVNRLSALGYVERREGRNKRSKALYLLPAGEAAFHKAVAIEKKVSRQLFGWMDERSLADFFEKIDEVRIRAEGKRAQGDTVA